eukprot:1158730-Pelagomonas_calceolata.AAC.7
MHALGTRCPLVQCGRHRWRKRPSAPGGQTTVFVKRTWHMSPPVPPQNVHTAVQAGHSDPGLPERGSGMEVHFERGEAPALQLCFDCQCLIDYSQPSKAALSGNPMALWKQVPVRA